MQPTNLLSSLAARRVRALLLLAALGGCAPVEDDAPDQATESGDEPLASDPSGSSEADTPDPLAAERFPWWPWLPRRDAGTPVVDAGAPVRDAGTVTPPVTPPATGSCRASDIKATPFGCTFAWGTADDKLKSAPNVQFAAKWVGYEVDKAGKIARCDGCTWLKNDVANTSLVPVYYAYFLGFFGHANGFADGNQEPNKPNLTTDGANLIRKNRKALIDMYAQYARASREAFPNRPLVWLLEGDHVQYAGESQKNRLSYAELAQFTAEISCAIKSNMPNAVVAINHSTWNPDQVTHDFWGAMKSAGVAYDLVWTTGVANNNGFFDKGTNGGSYNGKTATFRYVSQLTGRKILVDTSYGLSAAADSWSTASVKTLNDRIADGVIAANVVNPAGSFSQTIRTITPQLSRVCR